MPGGTSGESISEVPRFSDGRPGAANRWNKNDYGPNRSSPYDLVSVPSLRLGEILRNPFRQERALVFCEPQLLVHLESRRVLPHHFEMEGADSHRSRFPLHKFHRRATPSPPAIFLQQIELVNERIPVQPLQAVSKAQYDVPDSADSIQNQPRTAKIRIAQQRHQGHVRLFLIEAMPVEGVILPHKSQKGGGVRLHRQTELRSMVVHRSETLC